MSHKDQKVASLYNPDNPESSLEHGNTPDSPVRLLNRDGTFNILSEQKKPDFNAYINNIKDSYHRALSASWAKFFLNTIILYFGANLFFALLYYFCGPEGLSGIAMDSALNRFTDDFFFSVQTFSTIGYGKIVPASFAANMVVTLEALAGLLGFALATGILFSRFARPTSRVIFSDVAVIN